MKWFQHEEHQAIEAAVKAYRDALDGYQPTNDNGELDAHVGALKLAADAGELLADRVEQALRSTDWRRVEESAALRRSTAAERLGIPEADAEEMSANELAHALGDVAEADLEGES